MPGRLGHVVHLLSPFIIFLVSPLFRFALLFSLLFGHIPFWFVNQFLQKSSLLVLQLTNIDFLYFHDRFSTTKWCEEGLGKSKKNSASDRRLDGQQYI